MSNLYLERVWYDLVKAVVSYEALSFSTLWPFITSLFQVGNQNKHLWMPTDVIKPQTKFQVDSVSVTWKIYQSLYLKINYPSSGIALFWSVLSMYIVLHGFIYIHRYLTCVLITHTARLINHVAILDNPNDNSEIIIIGYIAKWIIKI